MWLSSLWLWPAAAIGLAGAAGTFLGTGGAVLVGGEALAILVIATCLLLLRRDGWLAIVIAAALTISLIVFAGFLWLRYSHSKNSRPTSAPTAARTLGIPDEATATRTTLYAWFC